MKFITGNIVPEKIRITLGVIKNVNEIAEYVSFHFGISMQMSFICDFIIL